MRNHFLSSTGVGKSCVLLIRVPNPSPTLDKNLASMGPGILSSVGVGVSEKAPEAFPDSNTTLDTFQSARDVDGDALHNLNSCRFGCGFFAYSWKLPAYSGAFLLTVDNFSFFTYNWSFFAYSFSFFTYSWSFFAYSGKVRVIRALKDCKQRSLTVSTKNSNCKKNFPHCIYVMSCS